MATFFVTSAAAEATADINFLKAIKTFCKRNNATPIILSARSHERPLKGQSQVYSSKIKEILNVGIRDDFSFNDNLFGVDAQINPQQINPLTGLIRYKHKGRESSLLIASPKQFLKVIATGLGRWPRIILSTGCCTFPDYQKNRIGLLAKQNHTLGGVIVEVKDDKTFLVRPVTYNEDKQYFIDLGVKYLPDNKIIHTKTAAIVLGDLHSENISEQALAITKEQLEFFKPDYAILHDAVSFNTISHHNENKIMHKFLVNQKYHSLQDEVDTARNVINTLSKLVRKTLVFVDSNHHRHVDQWVADGRFAKDHVNFNVGCKLALSIIEGKTASQCLLDPNNEFVWLKHDSDHYIAGVHISAHGDRGPNGSRGNPNVLSDTLGESITGHTHTPSMFEKHMCVGTNSDLRLDYNKGSSSWMQANAVIYADGGKQLLISIPGSNVWR